MDKKSQRALVNGVQGGKPYFISRNGEFTGCRSEMTPSGAADTTPQTTALQEDGVTENFLQIAASVNL